MRAVYKYVLNQPMNEIETHVGMKVVHVANQNEQITVWGEVETMAPTTTRTLFVVGTGHPVPEVGLIGEHLGAAVMADGTFVFHVYGIRD